MIIERISHSEKETFELGKKLGCFLKPGDLILLCGDLGGGKTTFVKGIAESLEININFYITSPTFSLINIYEGKYTIYHIDLYRLEFVNIQELGIWEYLNEGIVIIEWADKLRETLKEDYIEIYFKFLNFSTRKIILTGYGEWQELLKELDLDEV